MSLSRSCRIMSVMLMAAWPGSIVHAGCPDGFILDCDGICAPMEWIGDGICDDGSTGANFNCEEFGFDGGDCLGDGFGACCVGDKCFFIEFFICHKMGGEFQGPGTDCGSASCGGGCPPGLVADCNGLCVPAEWLGDGYCDMEVEEYEGKLVNLDCFELGCDGGDCACGEPILASCCFVNDCLMLSEENCVAQGGQWTFDRTCEQIVCEDSCPADLDLNGAVDVSDLLRIIATWGSTGGPEDIDFNSTVDIGDLLFVISTWGPCPVEPDHHVLLLDMFPLTAHTDVGEQDCFGSGIVEIAIDDSGSGDIDISNIVLTTVPVDTYIGSTGFMTLSLLPSGASGSYDPSEGTLSLDFDMEMTCTLIDQVAPPTCPDPVQDLWVYQRETWHGTMVSEVEELDDGSLSILGGFIDFVVATPVMGSVSRLAGPLSIGQQIKKKGWDEDIECPKGRRSNILVMCVQPVFICNTDDHEDCTGSTFQIYRDWADDVLGKACIEIDWKDPQYIVNEDWKLLEKCGSRADRNERTAIFNSYTYSDQSSPNDARKNACVEVFFVTDMLKRNGQRANGGGVCRYSGSAKARIIVADGPGNCNPPVRSLVAHELGHALAGRGHASRGLMRSGGPGDCEWPEEDHSKLTLWFVNRVRTISGGRQGLLYEKNPKENCCIEAIK